MSTLGYRKVTVDRPLRLVRGVESGRVYTAKGGQGTEGALVPSATHEDCRR